MYSLILITAMGTATSLATFDTREQCVAEFDNIKTAEKVSVACLPTKTAEQFEKELGVIMRSVDRLIIRMENATNKETK